MAQDPGDVVARFNQMKTARQTFDTYWQGVADYMLPSREFTRHSAIGSPRTASLIFNTLPINCLEQLAGALHGMLTSPSLRWFALYPGDPELADDEEVRGWFELATDRMYGVFTSAESGFDVSLHELYLDLAGMGTGCLYIADKGRAGPRFEARPLSEIYVSQGAEGRIDTLIRSYQLPVREVMALWPDTVTVAIKSKHNQDPDAKIDILHAVIPNADKSKWDSCYVLGKEKTELESGVFNGFPFAVPRWMKRSGEVYGFGPGMSMLPDVKLLNKLEELNLRGLAKVVDPAMLLPDDGFLNAPTTAPGGFNYYRSGMNGMMDKIGPMQTGARPDLAEAHLKIIQDRIEKGFYVNWMNLPSQPNMTATEVLQRRDEMLRLLGPMVSRVTSELLGPVIARTFEVMAANQLLPPVPQQLANRGYRVEYLSPLATAQKASDAESIMRWFAAIAQMAQIDPGVVDVVNTEEAARFLASRLGAPARVVRSQAEIDAKRQAAAKVAQQQHEMQAAQVAAHTANQGAGALANLQQLLSGQGQGGAPPGPGAPAIQPPLAAAA